MAFDRDEQRAQPASTAIQVDASAGRIRDANHRIAGLTLISAALAVFVAATFPAPLVLSMLSTLLMLVAATSACVACLFGQRLFSPHLTLWDTSAALVALSLTVSLEIDAAAVQAFLDAQSSTSDLGG